MNRFFLTLITLILYSSVAQGQDLHFSQFYAAPHLLNPSAVGNISGDYRVGLNGKSQWASVSVPYQTLSVYGDIAILQDRLFGRDSWIGAGIAVYADKAGDGVLTTIKVTGSMAFHKHLTDELYISLGAGFGYVSKSVDFNKLYFNSQWTDAIFDTTIDSGENFESNQTGYLDVNTGLSVAYTYNKRYRINFGASIQHINRPIESFFFSSNSNGNNKIGIKPLINISADLNLGGVSLHPGAMFQTQKKAIETVVGTNVSIPISERRKGANFNSKFYAGAWYRISDAVIGLAGVEFDQYRLLISYDVNVSELTAGSNFRGGLEFSLVHVGNFKPKKPRLTCPRF